MQWVSTIVPNTYFEVNQMNKDSHRDIERYVSTGVLMDVLEISRSTVYSLMAKGMPSIMVGSVHRFPDRAGFDVVRGELP